MSDGNLKLIPSTPVKRFSIATVLAVATIASPAGAQPSAADELVRQAEAKAKSGDFVEAAALYRNAYAAEPRAELICNVGVAYHKAGTELPRAQLFLSRCLDRGSVLDPKFVAAVRAVLTSVEEQLRAGEFTPVDIVTIPASTTVSISSFAVDEGFIGPRLVWLPFGTYTFTFTAEGYVTRSETIVAAARERVQRTVTLERPVFEVVPDAPPPRRELRAAPRPSKLPAIAVTAVTVGAAVFTVIAFQRAHDRADQASYAVSDGVFADDRAYVSSWNTRMGIGGVVALLGAAGSGLLWSRALRAPAMVEVDAGAKHAALWFRARW